MSKISLITVPKSPRTKSDEELAAACGAALVDSGAIALAEWNTTPWVEEALKGDLITSRGKAVAAVWAVYGAQLEILRLSVIDSLLLAELSESDRKVLRTKCGLERADRMQVANALWVFGSKQREELKRRREALNTVRQHAHEREARLREHVRTGPSHVNRDAGWHDRKAKTSQAGPKKGSSPAAEKHGRGGKGQKKVAA